MLDTTVTTRSLLEPTAIAGALTTDPTTLPAIDSSLLINTLAGLSLAGASDQPLGDIITSLDQVEGTLTLTNGFLTSDLTTPFGPWNASYDLVTLATDLNTTFQQASGTLNLQGGVASGNLSLDGEDFVGDFEFAQLISGFVTQFITDIDGTVPFQNGQFVLDIPTPFGDVDGTLDFGTGQLIADLTTPFGPLNFSIDFPEDAQYDFTAGGIPLTLDLNAGVIQADLLAAIPGPEASIPLSSLTGDIGFADGVATINLDTTLGNFSVPVDLASGVGETVATFLTDVTGTLTVGEGNLSADLVTPAGSFQGVLAASSLFNELIATLPNYNGTLTFSQGTIAAALTTPYGPVNETYNYGQYLGDIATFINDLTNPTPTPTPTVA